MNQNQQRTPPNPADVLNGVAVMQFITLGFLVGSQFMMKRNIRLALRTPQIKEVVVVYRDAKDLVE